MPKAEKLKKNGLDTTALPEFPYCFGEEGKTIWASSLEEAERKLKEQSDNS